MRDIQRKVSILFSRKALNDSGGLLLGKYDYKRHLEYPSFFCLQKNIKTFGFHTFILFVVAIELDYLCDMGGGLSFIDSFYRNNNMPN